MLELNPTLAARSAQPLSPNAQDAQQRQPADRDAAAPVRPDTLEVVTTIDQGAVDEHVARVRAQIAEGTYLTDERLGVAIDRVFARINE